MNAVALNERPVARATKRSSRFLTLLKREIWEHKGAVVWAPAILAAVQVLVTAVTSAVTYARFHDRSGDVTINGQHMEFTVDSLSGVVTKLSSSDLAAGGKGLDMLYYAASMWPLLLAGIVAFFYCVGAIYDERKDRSLLFWKSMPVSDRDTVLSKAVMALVIIPGVAMLVSAALVLVYAALASVACMFVGISPLMIWQHSNPLGVIASVFAGLPLHALWALPAAGWLLLCSAYAKRVPLLWAIGLPLLLGLIIVWIESGSSLGASSAITENYFHHIVYRILPGIVPGSFVPALGEIDIMGHSDLMPYSLPVLGEVYRLLLKPELWAGVIAGVGMISLAIRQRRHAGAL